MSSRFIIVMLLLGAASAVRAQDDPDRVRVLALEKTLSKIILQSEPSIACILVSRSDAYARFLDKDRPGRLGTFEPALIKGLSDDKERLFIKRQFDLADPGHIPQAFGSGVVIDAGGLVLTNYHVVLDATKIFVRLPGGKGSYADIHAADPRSDLAVLKLIDPHHLPLKTITLGDADRLERGHFLLTIANPFAAGFRDGQPSASVGILSNIRRRVLHELKEEERVKPLHYYSTLLQTDARLHLGSSGGAVLNLHGELVGLITSTAAIQGGETPGGFAIPINTATRRIIDVLKRGEEVDYGFLGIRPTERGGANGVSEVVLSTVGKGSPAAVDGQLRDGDVLLAVNGQPINDVDDIFVTIGGNLAGTRIRLLVRRNKMELTANVTLAKLYVPGKRIVSSLGSRPFFRGLRADYASLATQHPRLFDSHMPPGVMIGEVQPNSAAAAAKLKVGDVVTHVNGQPVNSPADFYHEVANVRGRIELTMYTFPSVDPALRVQLK